MEAQNIRTAKQFTDYLVNVLIVQMGKGRLPKVTYLEAEKDLDLSACCHVCGAKTPGKGLVLVPQSCGHSAMLPASSSFHELSYFWAPLVTDSG